MALVDIIERDEEGKIRHHYIVADYLAEDTGGTLKAGGDAADARWVPLDELDKYELTPKAKEVILKAWNG